MQTLTLTVKNIETLHAARKKLTRWQRLSSDERTLLGTFLDGLPTIEMLLNEKISFNDLINIEVFDTDYIWPHLEKWLKLFNSLPSETSFTGVHAMWIDAQCDDEFWKRNVIIEVSFIPTITHSKRKDSKSIYLSLKIDGTSFFRFNLIKDAENFSELYKFRGSWKEAYLLVVKTLQRGWPQTKFPEEFEQLLKSK